VTAKSRRRFRREKKGPRRCGAAPFHREPRFPRSRERPEDLEAKRPGPITCPAT